MIQILNLTKDYDSLRAVDQINFNINEGEIIGFLGPNGAGKSTTLKMMTSFLPPTDGNVIVDDLNIYDNSKEIRKLIGYLPESNPLYMEMTVYEYLEFVSKAREIPESEFKNALKRTIEKTGLGSVISKPINTLSKGYKQRVGLAQAIIHDPKIIILDEPTSGLDPNQIVEIRELIKELGKEKTLIISSHILQEVQAVCDRIVIINKGKIVADGSTEELKAGFKGKNRLHINFIGNSNIIEEIPEKIPGTSISSVEKKNMSTNAIVEYSSESDFRPEIYQWIKSTDIVLLEMRREHVSLEEVFHSLTLEGGKTNEV